MGLDNTSLIENPTHCYSVWNYDKVKQEIDIAACTHSTGIGAIWINQLQVGDKVYFTRPQGKFILTNNFENYFFCGDNSALGHLYSIRRQLTSEQNAKGIFYSSDINHLFPDLDICFPFDLISSNELAT